MPHRKSDARWHATPEEIPLRQLPADPLEWPPELAIAHEVQAEDATEADEAGSGKRSVSKRSRVHEAFAADPADAARCICQSNELLRGGGGICGEKLGSKYPQTLWTHLKGKHPRTHEALKGTASASQWIGSTGSSGDAGSNGAASSSNSSSFEGGSAVFPCVVTYRQMVDALCRAPPDVIGEAISALEQAKGRAEMSQ